MEKPEDLVTPGLTAPASVCRAGTSGARGESTYPARRRFLQYRSSSQGGQGGQEFLAASATLTEIDNSKTGPKPDVAPPQSDEDRQDRQVFLASLAVLIDLGR